MAQSDYEAGLRGTSNFVRTGKELTDWEAGHRAYLTNKDLANQIQTAHEEAAAAQQRETESKDPRYSDVRAAVERQMANEVSWVEVLFVRLPLAIGSAIERLTRTPMSNDELYMRVAMLLITIREEAKDRSAGGFDSCVRDLQTWVAAKCKREKKSLTAAQKTYVDTVREKCAANASRTRYIVDRMITARDSGGAQQFLSLLNELDGIFKPCDGDAGRTVFQRAAQAS